MCASQRKKTSSLLWTVSGQEHWSSLEALTFRWTVGWKSVREWNKVAWRTAGIHFLQTMLMVQTEGRQSADPTCLCFNFSISLQTFIPYSHVLGCIKHFQYFPYPPYFGLFLETTRRDWLWSCWKEILSDFHASEQNFSPLRPAIKLWYFMTWTQFSHVLRLSES